MKNRETVSGTILVATFLVYAGLIWLLPSLWDYDVGGGLTFDNAPVYIGCPVVLLPFILGGVIGLVVIVRGIRVRISN